MASPSKLAGALWPDVSTPEGARRAAREGFWAAIFVTAVTTGAATVAIFSGPVLGIGPGAFLDAGLFAIIAVGLWKMSRIAAVAGLGLFVAEKILFALDSGSFRGAHVALVLTLAFVHGVRGTIALARLTATPKPVNAAIEPK